MSAKIKLFDSELNVMNVLWTLGDTTAKRISDILGERIGWNINTTYTIIKRCIKKGAISRKEPNFLCHAEISKREVQQYELTEFINKMFDGAAEKLFAALIDSEEISSEEIQKLKEMVDDMK